MSTIVLTTKAAKLMKLCDVEALAGGILGGRPGADFWRLELLPCWSMHSARLYPRWYAGFVGCGARLSPTPIIHLISSHHPSPPTRSSPPAHDHHRAGADIESILCTCTSLNGK